MVTGSEWYSAVLSPSPCKHGNETSAAKDTDFINLLNNYQLFMKGNIYGIYVHVLL